MRLWRAEEPVLVTAGPEVIDAQVTRIRRRYIRSLRFGKPLEDQFEQYTAKERAHRLWLEGILAIVLLNACLLLDYLLVNDPAWKRVVLRTMSVTPVALAVNLLVRCDPPRWLREGSVAAGTTLICFLNLYVEGNATAPTTAYGLICVLITVLFADVVMRIRFPYAVTATALMATGALLFLIDAHGLRTSEKVIAGSMMAIGIAITMVASYSLEREERLGYLLHLRSELQTEELAALNAQLVQLSTVDKLTGLPNRRAFEERFEEFWAEGERRRTPLSAIVVDVDQFKILNDRLGHFSADKVLQRIAGLLPQELREQTDFVARFGGEEFVVLLPHTELDKAVVVAERMRLLIEMSGTIGTEEGTGEPPLECPTISCGVSMCVPSADVHPENLLKAADQALYEAKADGRNKVSYQLLN